MLAKGIKNNGAQSNINYSVIIPVYNERVNLESMLAETCGVLKSLDQFYEIIVVDDGSNDDTWKILVDQAQKYNMLRGLRFIRNFGKEAALQAGLEIARGQIIITMDGDGQHPPNLILDMIKVMQKSGVDIVEAVKSSHKNQGVARHMARYFFYMFLKKLTNYDQRGATDFKLFNRRVLDSWLKLPEQSRFFRGMINWIGFPSARILFKAPERKDGKSTFSFARLARLSFDIVTSLSILPLHFVTVAGVLFFAFALIMGIYTLALWSLGTAVSGFSTVIILLLIIGSLLMISLGIIGEYIAKIYGEVRQRPSFVIVDMLRTREEKDAS